MGSVVVVGGGLAGLVCAARLSRAGHDVELFEAAASVGGRLSPIETEHGTLELAVGEIGWADANLRALVASLGLASSDEVFLERKHGLVLGGRLHRPRPLGPMEFLLPRQRRGTVRYRDLRQRFENGPEPRPAAPAR